MVTHYLDIHAVVFYVVDMILHLHSVLQTMFLFTKSNGNEMNG